MQDHQFLKTLSSPKIKDTSVLGLWLFPKTLDLKPITLHETKWANELSAGRQKEYKYSRGCARFALSALFEVDPLKIPLHASPGQAPELAQGWGHISLSHCSDAVLIGWSPKKLGVDLERSNRSCNPTLLANRFFFKNEQEFIKNADPAILAQNVLSRWVIKEAAIKWQKGSIYQDLSQWESERNYKWAYNKSLKLKIETELIRYQSWIIAIAYDKKNHSNKPIICLA